MASINLIRCFEIRVSISASICARITTKSSKAIDFIFMLNSPLFCASHE
jgi:hypothetical protein